LVFCAHSVASYGNILHGSPYAGGVLDVELVGGFSPSVGDAFDLFNFASASGSFGLDLPTLPAGVSWNAGRLLTTGELVVVNSADFNADGAVDGADLLVWQRGLGLTQQRDNSRGDANGDGLVDGLDLAAWQQNAFGSAAAQASAVVPEPGSAALAAWTLVIALRGARARRPR
jgi:hypothetical protein